MKHRFLPLFGLLLAGLLAACSSPQPTLDAVGSVAPTLTRLAMTPILTPYITPTPTPTSTPHGAGTPTPFPTPTATPRSHVIKQGEDLLSIAWQYGLTLDELLVANPDVDPYLLSVDTVLVIPASSTQESGAGLPSPTPVAAALGDMQCYGRADTGLWCFATVENQGAIALESVSAAVRLADSAGAQVAEGTALTPLNVIPPGGTLPLMIFFSPPVPVPFQVNAVLQSAYPLQSAASRYANASLSTLNIEISADGLSAAVMTTVVFPDDTQAPGTLWVAAVAYDVSGHVVGVRRWEGEAPAPAEGLPVSMQVYSAGGVIVRVDVFVEARY